MSDNNPPINITAVWLRQEELGKAVVLVEYGGRWIEIIRENEGGPYSHICEANGIRARVGGVYAVKP